MLRNTEFPTRPFSNLKLSYIYNFRLSLFLYKSQINSYNIFMCGFIGSFSQNKIDLEKLNHCNENIVCRGPDSTKTYSKN